MTAKPKRVAKPGRVANAPPQEAIDWIAETEVVWVYRDRTRRTARVAIARPVQRSTGEWVCRIEGAPMQNRTMTIFGASSWQAMFLALQFFGYDVHHHVEVGGRIMWPLEPGQKRATACPPELLIGALFREPKAV